MKLKNHELKIKTAIYHLGSGKVVFYSPSDKKENSEERSLASEKKPKH